MLTVNEVIWKLLRVYFTCNHGLSILSGILDPASKVMKVSFG